MHVFQTTTDTVRHERMRAVAAGLLESVSSTFALLITVSWFSGSPSSKALVASALSIGFLLSPLIVAGAEKLALSPSRASGHLFLIAAIGFTTAALSGSFSMFLLGTVIGVSIIGISVPLITQIYNENYPRESRGRLHSRNLMIKIAVTALVSDVIGRILEAHLGWFPLIMSLAAGAALFSARCFYKIKTSPMLSHDGPRHIFRGLNYARTDRLFRQTLTSWMILGFANLMMAPLRVEYLANPRYGMDLSTTEIALYVAVIPNAVRLILSPLWGKLFDTINFFVVRALVNIGFMIGIFAFFGSSSTTGLIIGAIAYGVANAGGDIAWSLWVTKIAPPPLVADYMAAHTFLTGLRGLVAPLVAFYAATAFSPSTVGVISIAMIILASALLYPEIFKRPKNTGAATSL